MLNFFLRWLLFVGLYSVANAQDTLIAKQGFELNDETWKINEFSTNPCSIGDDHWNYLEQLNEISPSEGNRFWGIKDLNGECGSAGFESIEFSSVDLSQFRQVKLSFDLNVVGFDNGDDIKYQLIINGQLQEEQFLVEGTNNYSTEGWVKIAIDIPNEVASVGLVIKVKQNGSDLCGLDNFMLRGIPLVPCSKIMISEYIEGSSSSSYRNNYIELYNPTDHSIELSDYTLVKYTDNQLSPSATLNLVGQISNKGTFVIEDINEQLNINADQSTSSAVMDYNGDDKIALYHLDKIIDIIGQNRRLNLFCQRHQSPTKKPYRTPQYRI